MKRAATQSLKRSPKTRARKLHFPAMDLSSGRPKIVLSGKEGILRSLLLDVSTYIRDTDNVPRPELRFAGGWVRDKLLGVDSKDVDVAIDSMTGEKFGLGMKRFLDDRERSSKYTQGDVGRIAKIEANPEKSKNLETAVTTILGIQIDLVHLRKEVYMNDSRNPHIEPATPEEDASRRDATINALFYNLQTEEIEDFTGCGLKDMKLKVIRTPLEPFQTFRDDPLRVLRCIRFASRLGYSIDPEALKFMGDKRITDALQVKISRERVGIEIEKMLSGPDPRTALELIDRQGLYNTVFTNPTNPDVIPVDNCEWSRAYNFLDQVLKDTSECMKRLRSILLPSKEEVTYAWTVCAFTPWGAREWSTQLKLTSRSKQIFPAATVVAREGLKLDKKTLDIVQNASLQYAQVERAKTTFPEQSTSLERADLSERVGMEFRRWGSHWRSTVIYALLHQSLDGDRDALAREYESWLSQVEQLGSFGASALKPIVNGKVLMEAFERPSGPWLAEALEAIVRWQLRNPGSSDKEAAIKFALERVA